MQSPNADVTAVKWLTSLGVAAWVSVPSAVKLLMLVLCMDVVSALFNPRVQLKKVVKEAVASILLTLMAEVVWMRVMLLTNKELNFGFDPVTMVAVFYALRSGVDVLLNFNAVIPIPPGVVSVLVKAKGITAKEKADLESIKTED